MTNIKHIGMTYTRDDGEVIAINISVEKNIIMAEFKANGVEVSSRAFLPSTTLKSFYEIIGNHCENMDIVPF